MTRFYGKIGFLETYTEKPGVWSERIITRNYYGDILTTSLRWRIANGLNDNVVTTNRLSILADGYLDDHLAEIRYVEWEGVKWTVQNWEIQRPRIVLSLGDVYNAPED